MKFTVLSHAGLHVEHNGVSIVVDPWLIGSCYWRSWWNYPEPDRSLIDNLKPDYIYLTHLHWDHCHGPSLRQFDRNTKVLIPLVQTRRMRRDLRQLGFQNVKEISHGQRLELGGGLDLYSYQFGIGTDSAIVLTDGQTTLFNSNDCKLFGGPLRQITKRFKKIDFVFRSHSSASAIPYCVEGYETSSGQIRTQQDYVDEFSRFAIHIGARYAIPFASNHCFVHKDTIRFNETAVTPDRVSDCCNAMASRTGARTESVVMPPGSSWNAARGFEISEFDYGRKKEYVDQLSIKYGDKLAKQYEKEEKVLANFKTFDEYFTNFLAAVPAFITRRRKLKVIFKVKDREGDKQWLVDLNSRDVRPVKDEQADFIIESPAVVINDCTRKKMFSVWTASKRLKIISAEDEKLADVVFFFYLLDLYETDFFPLRRLLNLRSLQIGARRWRELGELIKMVFKHWIIKKPFKVADLYPVPTRGLSIG